METISLINFVFVLYTGGSSNLLAVKTPVGGSSNFVVLIATNFPVAGASAKLLLIFAPDNINTNNS